MNSKKVTEFAELIPNTALLQYLESASISVPTQVQRDAIPKLMGTGHYSIQSRTGTGKTLAYLLPIITRLKALEEKESFSQKGSPQVVVVAPTRELALQIFAVAKEVSHFAKLRIRKLVGGDKGKSLKSVFATPLDILVTTPDRALRAFKNKELRAEKIQFLVLDEADQLLEPSFKKTMKEMCSLIKNEQMQIFLVSASRPAHFDDTVQRFFPGLSPEPIGQENVLNHDVSVTNVYLEEIDKFIHIHDFLRKRAGSNGLIFTGNKARAKRLFEELAATEKHTLSLLHKDLEIAERVAVVESFRKRGGVFIATDIFARGMDVPHLEWVLNFDLPSEPYYYLHRSGRVGRAGRSGEVYNFITSKDAGRLASINKALVHQGRAELKISDAPKKSSGSRVRRSGYKSPSSGPERKSSAKKNQKKHTNKRGASKTAPKKKTGRRR